MEKYRVYIKTNFVKYQNLKTRYENLYFVCVNCISSTPKFKHSKILHRVTLSSSFHQEGFFKIYAFDHQA